jgi:hypothetical protein
MFKAASLIAAAWRADPFARTDDLAARLGVSRSAALAHRPGDLPPLGMGRNRAGVASKLGPGDVGRAVRRQERERAMSDPDRDTIDSWVAKIREGRGEAR